MTGPAGERDWFQQIFGHSLETATIEELEALTIGLTVAAQEADKVAETYGMAVALLEDKIAMMPNCGCTVVVGDTGDPIADARQVHVVHVEGCPLL